MTLIDRVPAVQKREDADLKRFAQFLRSKGFPRVTIIDKPDETLKITSQKGKFDYLIEVEKGGRIALEFTQLFEVPTQRIQRIQWSNLVSAFRKELKKYLSSGQGFHWSGIWAIETPNNFGASRQKSNNIAKRHTGDLLRALEGSFDGVQIAGMSLKLRKVVEQPEGDLYFSSATTAATFLPSQDILPELMRLLPAKNRQLDTKKGKRYLVILNRHPLASLAETVDAMSRVETIWAMKNMDRIYFEESPGYFFLIFSKELTKAWLDGQPAATDEFLFVLQLWLPSLRALNPNRTFHIVWEIIKGKKVYEVFPDSYTREEIVRLGQWLAEQKRFDDLCSLIDRFIDDPDPPEPGDYKGDPAFDYHQQIVNGEDPGIVTTVRGHLSWLVQKITLQREHIVLSLGYAKTLLQYANLYAKLQAIVPLIEIAARRQWLEEMAPEKYWEFHSLVFDLLRHYSRYSAIGNLLTGVFYYFKDLTTDEALEVLEHLRTARESGTLYVYFGIFRQRHYKNADGTDKKGFDAGPLQKQLQQAITAQDNIQLKTDIAWNLWRIVKDKPDELQTLKPYIELFLEQPYQQTVYKRLEMIIKECLSLEPQVAITWFVKVLSRLSEFLEVNAQEARNTWLTSAQEVMVAIAMNRPEDLIEIMTRLARLWLLGVYIGNPGKLLETFKLTKNRKLKTKVKREFKRLYRSMKEVHTKLVEVDWN